MGNEGKGAWRHVDVTSFTNDETGEFYSFELPNTDEISKLFDHGYRPVLCWEHKDRSVLANTSSALKNIELEDARTIVDASDRTIAVHHRFAPMPYLTISSMDRDSAKRFAVEGLGVKEDTIDRIEDAGPARGDRYKPGARIFHVYTRKRES